ncbi:hypothetical protein GGTG_07925 [Gaeumannomyces tritici R3-111a-1]|uniref:Uncharacterized protein n=1 Tax=Gaeumannomyces tritici (strain R3-111a-1) TaxID=644352 RepID=J3P334_GAET3|nr:hypothetical protein GGTG_07925 [Gaeumannomyces tritici R3-111a-1]EJT74076.1 hypothetical protein GGTG_07925 [Gaeumannomyces tritici R3-111a-1]
MLWPDAAAGSEQQQDHNKKQQQEQKQKKKQPDRSSPQASGRLPSPPSSSCSDEMDHEPESLPPTQSPVPHRHRSRAESVSSAATYIGRNPHVHSPSQTSYEEEKEEGLTRPLSPAPRWEEEEERKESEAQQEETPRRVARGSRRTRGGGSNSKRKVVDKGKTVETASAPPKAVPPAKKAAAGPGRRRRGKAVDVDAGTVRRDVEAVGKGVRRDEPADIDLGNPDDGDDYDDSELLDSILDGIATVSVSAAVKLDDAGRWRVLRQSGNPRF